MPAQTVVPRRIAALALVLALAAGWWPAPSRGTTAIPSQQTGQQLAGATVTAIVGDIDGEGDGVRELVRLSPRVDDPVHLAIEAFEQRADGSVASLGTAPLERMASVTEALSGLPRPDDENLLQARIDEPARLIVWHVAGAERVLAVAIGTQRNARACCLTIWQVEREAAGIGLRLLTDTMRSADQVRAVDMDADGTDELVVTEPPEAALRNEVSIAVLRWTGRRFGVLSGSLTPAGGAPLLPLGDSDGRPGDEVGLASIPGSQGERAVLHRIALGPNGGLRVERAELPFPGTLVPMRGPGGGRLVLGDDENGSSVLAWPAGQQQVRVEASTIRRGVPIASLGRGSEARVVILRGGQVVDVLGPQLRSDRSGISSTRAAAIFERNGIVPYVGTLAGGLPDGQAAVIFRGRLITRVPPGSDSPRIGIARVATLPGVVPVGVLGRSNAALVLAVPTSLDLAASFDATREGGQLAIPAGGVRAMELVVANAQTTFTEEADNGLLEPELDGAIREEGPTGQPVALARAGFVARVSGPVGARVLLRAGDSRTEAQIGDGGSVDLMVGQQDSGQSDEFTAWVMVTTPSGHGYGSEWGVEIVGDPPPLQASSPMAPLSFEVPVSGRTAPGTSVAIDGTAVQVAADGSFLGKVVAGPLPRDVRIEVTDRLGNRSITTLSVVGFVDYRRLPWIPIVVILTLLAGGVLYLRVPRAAPRTSQAAPNEGTLEELD
jgi:hypothetical protein